jgi:hypothetical protein
MLVHTHPCTQSQALMPFTYPRAERTSVSMTWSAYLDMMFISVSDLSSMILPPWHCHEPPEILMLVSQRTFDSRHDAYIVARSHLGHA